MNLQCAHLHLVIASPSPAPVIRPTDDDEANQRLLEAANDNEIAWPLMPFPEDWCASS